MIERSVGIWLNAGVVSGMIWSGNGGRKLEQGIRRLRLGRIESKRKLAKKVYEIQT